MVVKYLFILFAVFIAIACNRKPQTITQVDFKTFESKMNTGAPLTQEEVNKLMWKFQLDIQKNTTGRLLPDLQICDVQGNEYNLPDIIRRKTIIEISDAHCGFGIGCTLNDLPGIIARLKEKYDDFDVVCLVIKTKADNNGHNPFNTYLTDLKPLYPALYVIDEGDAGKLNVAGSPTRLLVDKNRTVVKISTGMAVDPELLYNELAGFLKDVHGNLFKRD